MKSSEQSHRTTLSGPMMSCAHICTSLQAPAAYLISVLVSSLDQVAGAQLHSKSFDANLWHICSGIPFTETGRLEGLINEMNQSISAGDTIPVRVAQECTHLHNFSHFLRLISDLPKLPRIGLVVVQCPQSDVWVIIR